MYQALSNSLQAQLDAVTAVIMNGECGSFLTAADWVPFSVCFSGEATSAAKAAELTAAKGAYERTTTSAGVCGNDDGQTGQCMSSGACALTGQMVTASTSCAVADHVCCVSKPVSTPSATFGSCLANSKPGTCMDEGECTAGTVHDGLCTGTFAATVKCCVANDAPTTSAACFVNGKTGQCIASKACLVGGSKGTCAGADEVCCADLDICPTTNSFLDVAALETRARELNAAGAHSVSFVAVAAAAAVLAARIMM